MSNKIVALNAEKIGHTALLHQVLERENVDGVVMVVRVDGRWHTCWSNGVSAASLCMAAMKLSADVNTATLHDHDAPPSDIGRSA